MAFPTPDNPPGPLTVVREVLLPADPHYLALVAGALSELINPDNYESWGSQTAEDTAEFFLEVLSDFYDSTS